MSLGTARLPAVPEYAHAAQQNIHDLGDEHVVDGLVLHEETQVQGAAEHVEDKLEINAGRQLTARDRGIAQSCQLGDVSRLELLGDVG